MTHLTINSAMSLDVAIEKIKEQWLEHRYLEIEIRRKAKQRTLTQNAALHLFMSQLADTLNDAGMDMRRTLKPGVEIPWTPESVKDHLWRPIQEALTGRRSTTELKTLDPTVVHQTLARHLGEKLGVVCPPWPSREREVA